MYRVILSSTTSSAGPSYEERKQLANELDAIVRKYFSSDIRSASAPCVTWSQTNYNYMYYRFDYASQYRDTSAIMYANGYDYEADENVKACRSEVRAFLKSNGFTKMKFEVKNTKVYYSQTEYDIRKELVGISFDVPNHFEM